MDLDAIGHAILSTAPEPLYVQTRQVVADTFNVPLTPTGVDRAALGRIIFNDQAQRERLNMIMADPMRTYFRRSLSGKRGIIAVNAALIAEFGWSPVVNNNTLLIDVNRATQEQRLQGRGHDATEIERRINGQHTTAQKAAIFEQEIETYDHGHTWKIDNSDGTTINFDELFHMIADGIGYKS